MSIFREFLRESHKQKAELRPEIILFSGHPMDDEGWPVRRVGCSFLKSVDKDPGDNGEGGGVKTI
jgi:hypothetical protein